MTIHNWRIIQAPRKRSDTIMAPRLAPAARLISKLTGIKPTQCTIIINDGKPFSCEFRKIVQYQLTLNDYGYVAMMIPKYKLDKKEKGEGYDYHFR